MTKFFCVVLCGNFREWFGKLFVSSALIRNFPKRGTKCFRRCSNHAPVKKNSIGSRHILRSHVSVFTFWPLAFQSGFTSLGAAFIFFPGLGLSCSDRSLKDEQWERGHFFLEHVSIYWNYVLHYLRWIFGKLFKYIKRIKA